VQRRAADRNGKRREQLGLLWALARINTKASGAEAGGVGWWGRGSGGGGVGGGEGGSGAGAGGRGLFEKSFGDFVWRWH